MQIHSGSVYLKPIETIDEYLVAHRAFLDTGYQQNFLIASGPQIPRTGGVLLSQLKDKATFEAFLEQDPFHLHGLARYEILEFTPVKSHPNFLNFL